MQMAYAIACLRADSPDPQITTLMGMVLIIIPIRLNTILIMTEMLPLFMSNTNFNHNHNLRHEDDANRHQHHKNHTASDHPLPPRNPLRLHQKLLKLTRASIAFHQDTLSRTGTLQNSL